MRSMRFVLIFVLLCLSTQAAAQEDRNQQAKQAFAQGREFFEQGEYIQAAEAFHKANELRPNWRLLYNIAQSEASARRHGAALQAFEKYLAEGGDEVPADRVRNILEEIMRLRAIVGAVEIKAPDGAVVLLDGYVRETAPLPGPMMITAGTSHTLEIKHDGVVIYSRKLRVNGGQTAQVDARSNAHPDSDHEVTGPPSEPPEPESTPMSEATANEDVSPGNRLGVIGWTFLGTGGAALIGSVVTGVLALSKGNQLEEVCPNNSCTEEHWDDNDTRKALAFTTDALIGVGAALAVTGTILVVLHQRKKNKESDTVVSFTGNAISGRF